MPVLVVGAGLVAGFLVAALFGDGLRGAIFGAIVGWLFLRQFRLASRIRTLEARLAEAKEGAPRHEVVRGTLVAPPEAPAATAQGEGPPPSDHASEDEPTPAAPPPTPPALPGWRWLEVAKRWLLQGNLPAKVGMVVLFAGVSAFLKYAADEGWLHAPIEVRLGAVALAAMGALVFGFRERERRRAFSLALQGGAIGILHLTVFVAFRFYDLVPQELAFALLVCLVAGTGVLAVVQNAPSLAVLATLAGFLAPILVSRGGGSHVVLFSWYAILDLLVVAVAWWKRWRLLGSLAFALTTAFVGAWTATRYEPQHFWSVQAFSTLFYAFFICLSLLEARRTRVEAAVSSLLVFGNPIFYLGMQARMLHDTPLVLAFVALGVAAAYIALTAFLRGREQARTLRDSFAVLAIAAATLAVPLALSAELTTGIFALEGAALIWLAFRQGRRLPLVSGLALQVVAALIFLEGLGRDHAPFSNAAFLSGLWVIAAGSLSAWLTWREDRRGLAAGAACWTLFLWGLSWSTEILLLPIDDRAEAFLVWAVATACLLAEANRRVEERLVAWAASLWMVWALVAAIVQAQDEPFAGWGALAWVAFFALGVRALDGMRRARRPELAILHLAFQGSLAAGLMGLGVQLSRALELGGGWRAAAGALALLILHGGTLLRSRWIAAPVEERFSAYRKVALGLQAAGLGLWFLLHLGRPGSAAPLPYVPLLNPLDLAVVAWLLLVGKWLQDEDAPSRLARLRLPIVAALGFVAITAATFRAVHWIGGLSWGDDLVSRMELQASLSVVWSVVGVVSWVVGSRRGSRPLWLVGAVLLSLVLLKLAVVDRTHLGNLAGIVSFLAFGILCTLVGYLAPAPPRDETRLST